MKFKKGQIPWNKGLTKEESVHHINRIRNDDRIENLRLFSTFSEHMKFHMLGNKNGIRCKKCY